MLASLSLHDRTLEAVIATRLVSKETSLFALRVAREMNESAGEKTHRGPARIAGHAWQELTCLLFVVQSARYLP